MSQRSDIDRVLEVWMADGPTAIPDRVVDVVAARIGVQRQRRAWPFPWRTNVTAPIKLAAALAAVLIVAIAGVAILGRPAGSNVGGTVPSAPTPSNGTGSTAPSVSVAPSASAAYPAWFTGDRAGAGILQAGKQATRSFQPRFTFSVPEGWVNDIDVAIGYGLFPGTKANEAEYALSGEISQGIFVVSVDSPYFFCEPWERTRGTAAERAAFLAASDAFVVSEPVDVTIGRLTGKQLDVRLDPERPTATCPGDPATVDLADQRTRLTYLDAPSGIVAIGVGSKHSANHVAFLAEAMPIVESFEFK